MDKIISQHDINLSKNHNHCQGMETTEPCPSGPRPRCLATLPSNIEEIIHEFKMQGKRT